MKKNFALLLLFFTSTYSLFSQDFAPLFKKLDPSVVVIYTKEKSLTTVAGMGKAMIDAEGLGSGVLISEEGDILTASHVVHTAEDIMVKFSDGDAIPAKVIASNPSADVALIRLVSRKANATVAKIGDSDQVKTGEMVMVIGAPLGLEHSLSTGYISGKHESHKTKSVFSQSEFFQTDASINKGNSGGPMFNMDGEVIGIVSYILSESGGFEGIGFAATSNIAKKLVLGDNPFWSGLEGIPLTGELAEIFNLPQPIGLLVQKVVPLTPADIMGVRGGIYEARIEGQSILLGGDIILAINDIALDSGEKIDEIVDQLASLKTGDSFTFTVFRAGKKEVLKGVVP